MQFTEISEVQATISMLRLHTQDEIKFHDRHDSEVDRLYNSSPTDDVQMNQYIDTNCTTPSPAVPHPKTAELPNKDEKPTGKHGKVIVFELKKPNEESEEIDLDEKEVEVEEDTAFEKEPVDAVYPTSSVLGKILKDSGDGAPKLPAHAPDSAMLKLTIYLPNTDEMTIELYEVSSVEETIETILRQHRAEDRTPHLYYGHPECYELRLHDQDGLPDEDFPALDRSRKIANFGDAGNHEYCLCERPDACPPAVSPTSSTRISNASAVLNVEVRGQRFLKIFMPNDDYTVVAVDVNTTGQDLLPALQKKHRLQLFQEEYVFRIHAADKERLDLPTDIIDLQTKLKPLGVQEMTLTKKTYADTPQVAANTNAKGPQNASDQSNSGNRSLTSSTGRTRPQSEIFMYNDVTVAMYKEWEVIKKNKYGKKQNRMLGIDINKIYNKKVGEKAVKSKTVNEERLIASIQTVEFNDDPSDFYIIFNEPEVTTIEYTAATPYECAEIVAKLKYIISRGLSSKE